MKPRQCGAAAAGFVEQERETAVKKKESCKGDHRGHLCVLVSEGKVSEIKALVGNPSFICFNCGRAADSDKNLCNPMPLED